MQWVPEALFRGLSRQKSDADHSPATINKKRNSVALVRERTIPTERAPLVGEVTANFCGEGYRVVSAADPLRP
jgi:hypothetical protein